MDYECSLLTGWLRALRERSCNTPHKGMPVYKRQGADANLWPCLTRSQQPVDKLPKEWSSLADDSGPLPLSALSSLWINSRRSGLRLQLTLDPHSLALVLGVRKKCGICFVISGL